VGSSFIPGLGALNAGKGATALASMGKAALAGAGQGAISGLGTSNEDDISGMAVDTATGAGTGAIVGGLASGAGTLLGKAKKAIDPALAKIGKIFANVPEDATARYLARSEQVNASQPLEDVAQYVRDEAIPKFKSNLQSADSTAWDTLSQAPTFNKSDILDVAEQAKSSILKGKPGTLTRSAGTGGAADEIAAIQGQIEQLKSAYGDQLSESDIKSIIQGLQAKGYAESGAPATSLGGGALKDLSGKYNEFLKSRNANYATAMEPVAESTAALKQMGRMFVNKTNPDDLSKATRALSKYDELNSNAIQTLDRITGADVANKAKDSITREAFEKADTNGSRKTVAGALLGKAVSSGVGAVLGYEVGGDYGAGIGAGAGLGMDKYAGKVFKGFLNGKITASQVAAKFANTPFANFMTKAAEKGNASFAATTFILQQNNPEYRKLMQKLDEEN